MAENNIMNVLDLAEETKKYIATLYPQDVSFDTRLLSIYRTLLEEQKKQPYNINLVSLIGADETAHSRVLCRLLQYPGEDNTYPFALQFIENFISAELVAEMRKQLSKLGAALRIETGKDLIDIQIFMKGVLGIIIENKIQGAVDQKKQLHRYIETVRGRGIKEPYAIYLTWDGSKKVSDDSLSKQEQQRMQETGHFIELNYVFDILPWLKEKILPYCPYAQRQLIFAVEQYIDYLELRASYRTPDQVVNQAIYRAFYEQFVEEKLYA